MKGNPMSAKAFNHYTGNVKAKGNNFPSANPPTKANGGNVKGNLRKTVVAKKMK